MCGIPPWPVALRERRRSVLGEAAAAFPSLSLAPLTRALPAPGAEAWPRRRQPLRFTPWSSVSEERGHRELGERWGWA